MRVCVPDMILPRAGYICIYTYTHTHTRTQTHKHTHTHTNTNTHTHTNTNTNTHRHTHTHIYIYIHTHLIVYLSPSLYVYVISYLSLSCSQKRAKDKRYRMHRHPLSSSRRITPGRPFWSLAAHWAGSALYSSVVPRSQSFTANRLIDRYIHPQGPSTNMMRTLSFYIENY